MTSSLWAFSQNLKIFLYHAWCIYRKRNLRNKKIKMTLYFFTCFISMKLCNFSQNWNSHYGIQTYWNNVIATALSSTEWRQICITIKKRWIVFFTLKSDFHALEIFWNELQSQRNVGSFLNSKYWTNIWFWIYTLNHQKLTSTCIQDHTS